MRLEMFALIGDKLKEILPSIGTIGLFLIVFAESGLMVGFFLPGDSLLFIAGLLSYQGLLAPIVVVSLGCFLAAVIGDQVGYMTGAKFGPGMFNRPESRLFKRERLEEAEAFFDRHGAKAIVLARFVPVVRTFTPIIAGTSKMDRRTFTIYNLIGGFVWAVGFTQAGYWLGQRWPELGERMELVILVIVAASLTPVIIHVIMRRRRMKSEARAVAPQPAEDAA